MTGDLVKSHEIAFDRMFGVVAPALGWVPPLRYLLRRKRVLRLVKRFAPGKLLEVGCGAGALLIDLSQLGHECIGLETSPRAFEIARALAAGSRQKREITTTAGDDWGQRFDTVCAFDVLEHINEDRAALEQWVAWTKPGGNVLLSVPAHSRRWGAGDVWAGHYRRYDRAPLVSLLTNAGLQIKHIESYGFPLANLTEWVGEYMYARQLKQGEVLDRDKATAESGIQRDTYVRYFTWIESFPGRLAVRAAYAAQSVASRSDVGSGFIVWATRR